MDKTINEAAESGETLDSTARELGVSVRSLKSYVGKMNIQFRKGRPIDMRTRACIMEMVGNGLNTSTKLANALGKARGTVHRVLTNLLSDKLLSRTGNTRASRLKVTKRWSDGYKDKEGDDD